MCNWRKTEENVYEAEGACGIVYKIHRGCILDPKKTYFATEICIGKIYSFAYDTFSTLSKAKARLEDFNWMLMANTTKKYGTKKMRRLIALLIDITLYEGMLDVANKNIEKIQKKINNLCRSEK